MVKFNNFGLAFASNGLLSLLYAIIYTPSVFLFLVLVIIKLFARQVVHADESYNHEHGMERYKRDMG